MLLFRQNFIANLRNIRVANKLNKLNTYENAPVHDLDNDGSVSRGQSRDHSNGSEGETTISEFTDASSETDDVSDYESKTESKQARDPNLLAISNMGVAIYVRVKLM